MAKEIAARALAGYTIFLTFVGLYHWIPQFIIAIIVITIISILLEFA